MYRRISYTFLCLFLCIFTFNINVKAISIEADGEPHDTGIRFNPAKIAGDSSAQGSCSSNDPNLAVKIVKVGGGEYTCYATATKPGDYSFEYGIIDGIGAFVSGGKASVSVGTSTKQEEQTSETTPSSGGETKSQEGSSSTTTTSGGTGIDANCKTGIFGDPDTPGHLAWYLQIVFNVIKFSGPVLAILLTIKDLLSLTAQDKMDGEMVKVGKRAIKRVIYAILIFVLPIILNVFLEFLGLYTVCIH